MSSLLSWDDYEEDPNPNVAKAAKAVKEIDTTEVMAELEKTLAPKNIEPLNVGSMEYRPDLKLPEGKEVVVQQRTQFVNFPDGNEILKRAQDAIHNMDGELQHGGRLKADDKKLLNSATDLNQLVPFKYDWAWMGYLESCNAHWMPPEIPLEKDKAELEERKVKPGEPPTGKEPFVIGANHRKMVCDLLVNHYYIKLAVPNQTWLNLYRMVENPEGRQYLLRQTFEGTIADHSMAYVQECLGIMTQQLDGMALVRHLHLLEDSYKERHLLLKEFLPTMLGTTGTTVGEDNLREFIIEMAILYGVANWISFIRPIYHVIKLERQTGKLQGITKLADLMLRDLVHHQQLFKQIFETALFENPEVVDQKFRNELVHRLKKLGDVENDLSSVFSVDEHDYKDLAWLIKYNMSSILTMVGIHTSGNDPIPSPFMEWFMGNLKNHEIKIHGGASTVTGQNGGALSW